jgi:hypothetical protein
MTRAFFFVLTFVAYAITPARAQDAVRVEITEYGIYAGDVTRSERDSNGIVRNAVNNIRHAATTTTVPAQIGVHFGFRYRIVGKPAGQPIEIKKVTIYPEGGVRPSQSAQPQQKTEYTLTRKIGDDSYTDYSLDDPWELVPGKWTFQLWYGDRKLVEQSFTLVAKR